MLNIGRLCVKIAGRDAKGTCVIVDVIDDQFVMIDGNVRRRKCNIKHLYPLDTTIKLKKGAPHTEVEKEFKKLDLEIWSKKKKEAAAKPKKERKKKEKTAEKEASPEKAKKEKKTAKTKETEKKKTEEEGLEAKAEEAEEIKPEKKIEKQKKREEKDKQ